MRNGLVQFKTNCSEKATGVLLSIFQSKFELNINKHVVILVCFKRAWQSDTQNDFIQEKTEHPYSPFFCFAQQYFRACVTTKIAG